MQMDTDTLLAALAHFSSSLFKHYVRKSMIFRSDFLITHAVVTLNFAL